MVSVHDYSQGDPDVSFVIPAKTGIQ